MAHLLTPITPVVAVIPARSNNNTNGVLPICLKPLHQLQDVNRRTLTLGIAGAFLGLKIGDKSANAAARRAPPPPPKEKKDPNVTGLLAKVLANKKRKEAMKETIARLKEQGRPIKEGPSE